MANGDPHQSLSSAFDDMLTDTWRELDGLYDGSSPPPVRNERPGASPARTAESQSGARHPASRPSDAERFLNDRYGDGWKQEILEQKRDGDEVVVLCRLIIKDHDISKTQFGRARILGAASAAKVTGSAGGVGFSLGGQRVSGRISGSDAEAAAYREAARDALAKCAAML